MLSNECKNVYVINGNSIEAPVIVELLQKAGVPDDKILISTENKDIEGAHTKRLDICLDILENKSSELLEDSIKSRAITTCYRKEFQDPTYQFRPNDVVAWVEQRVYANKVKDPEGNITTTNKEENVMRKEPYSEFIEACRSAYEKEQNTREPNALERGRGEIEISYSLKKIPEVHASSITFTRMEPCDIITFGINPDWKIPDRPVKAICGNENKSIIEQAKEYVKDEYGYTAKLGTEILCMSEYLKGGGPDVSKMLKTMLPHTWNSYTVLYTENIKKLIQNAWETKPNADEILSSKNKISSLSNMLSQDVAFPKKEKTLDDILREKEEMMNPSNPKDDSHCRSREER